jgi:15-hydroxyprostaglandin dehydrogenase (NAD)
MGGLITMPTAPVYAATKAGVIHFTRSTDEMVRASGVRLCALCPSFTHTKSVDEMGLLSRFSFSLKRAESLNDLKQVFGRLLSSEEVADGFIQLVQDDSRQGAVMRVTVQSGIDYWVGNSRQKGITVAKL